MDASRFNKGLCLPHVCDTTGDFGLNENWLYGSGAIQMTQLVKQRCSDHVLCAIPPLPNPQSGPGVSGASKRGTQSSCALHTWDTAHISTSKLHATHTHFAHFVHEIPLLGNLGWRSGGGLVKGIGVNDCKQSPGADIMHGQGIEKSKSYALAKLMNTLILKNSGIVWMGG